MKRVLLCGAAAAALLVPAAGAVTLPELGDAPIRVYPYAGASLGQDALSARRTDAFGAGRTITDGLDLSGFGWDVQGGVLFGRPGSRWSFGLEASYGDGDARYEVRSGPSASGFEAGRSWSVMGVVGYQWCPCGFATARLGWRQTEFTDFSPTGSLSEDLGGFTVGTEFGFPVADQVMFKIGYDHTFYEDFTGIPFPGTTREVTPDGGRARIGFDIFFGGDSGAPVTQTQSTTEAMPPPDDAKTPLPPLSDDAPLRDPLSNPAIDDPGPPLTPPAADDRQFEPVTPPENMTPGGDLTDPDPDHEMVRDKNWSFSIGGSVGLSRFGGEQTDRFGGGAVTTDGLSGSGTSWSASIGAAYRFANSPIFLSGELSYGDANASFDVTSGAFRSGMEQGQTWGVTGMVAYTPCPCGYGGLRLGWRQSEFTDFSPTGSLSLDLSGVLVGVEFGAPIADNVIITIGYDETYYEDFQGSPALGVIREFSPRSRELHIGTRLTW